METPDDKAGQATSVKSGSAPEKKSEIKVPQDLSKVSNAKARELIDAGLVEDHELPGKWYKRKSDGFKARIPDYTYDAYDTVLKDEWEEVKSDAIAPTE